MDNLSEHPEDQPNPRQSEPSIDGQAAEIPNGPHDDLTESTGFQPHLATRAGVISPADVLDELSVEGVPESTEQRWRRLLPDWQFRFCLALKTVGVMAAACKRVNVSRFSVNRARQRDPVFNACFAEAEEDSIDAVETSLRTTATVGDVQPIYQGGRKVGSKRVKDARAAEVILRAKRASVYRHDYEAPKVASLLLASADQVAEVVRSLSPALAAKPIPGRVIATDDPPVTIDNSATIKPPTE